MATSTPPSTNPPPVPLPRIRGPKLEPFRGTATVDLEFIRSISNEDDIDSKVWKVRVDDKYYALKIFPFWHWKGLKTMSGSWALPPEDELTPQDCVDYLDPFNNECRVYGRLRQEKHEDIAVHAHGYILLTREQERHVTEACYRDYTDPEMQTADELDGQGLWGRWEWHRHEPLRAILKDFVDERTPNFEKSQILQIYEDIETLHSLGILIRDIHPGNYLGGKIIDFSRSWTMYHPYIDLTSREGIFELRIDEVKSFLDMIVAWANFYETTITLPERLEDWTGGVEGCGIDPCVYDWRNWEEVEPISNEDDKRDS